LRVSDRSRYEEYFKCPRKRYWAYEYGGRGIQGVGKNEDLAFGAGVHNGMEELILTGDMDLALKRLEVEIADCTGETADGYSKYDEWYALGRGMLELFNAKLLPETKETFEIKDTELEIVLELTDNLIWMTRIDGHLHRLLKGNDLPYVWEYKTSATNYASELINSAQHNFQFLMEAAALQEHYAKQDKTIYVGGTQLVVLLKGQKTWATDAEKKRGISGQRRISPFTYAYFKGDPFADPSAGCDWWPKYKAGWTRLPVWVYPGIERWYSKEFFFDPEHGSREYLDGLIFEPPPISLDRKQFENLKAQIIAIEDQIAAGADLAMQANVHQDKILDHYFPQNFLNCHKDGGFNKKDCPFVGVCHEGEDPNPDGGIYQWREPNHPFEDQVLVPLEV
jgi:hypothetical protein